MSTVYQALIEFMAWVHVYLPEAGITELAQLALNSFGLFVHLWNFVDIARDRLELEAFAAGERAFRRSEDYRSARTMVIFGMLGEATRLVAQVTLLANSGISLFQPPPPPDFFSELEGPFVPAWLRGHACLALLSVWVIVGSLIAWLGRRWVRRRQRTRLAVRAGELAPADASLLEQLGGDIALQGIVADWDARLLRDVVLAPYFAGVQMKRLEHAQTVFLGALLAGRPTPADLREVHAHLSIQDAHFTQFAALLRDTLDGFDVSPALSARVLARVESTRDQIVTGRPS